jgi:D-alanyl-lipoteichoic acid acyltransferase DltB (MBOAT superfamily)
VWLLIASWGFYLSIHPAFLGVLLLITGLAYGISLKIASAAEREVKKRWRTFGFVAIVLPLVVFKFFDFSIHALPNGLFQPTAAIPSFLMPLGLSFYTFSALAYLIDVYRGSTTAQRNFFRFALFLAFFPKLTAGPIERANALMAQLVEPAPFAHDRFVRSAVRVGWGLLKKLLIANRLAVVADAVFTAPGGRSAPVLIAGVLAFTFQVYIDFAAYCDIAIGAAGLLGIDLSENFRQPYFSRSITDFWRRWHITFSSWLRDYLFLPLNFASRRKSLHLPPRKNGKPQPHFMQDLAQHAYTYRNILVTFLISGLWHGSNWTFLAWGFLHGLYQAVELYRSHRKATSRPRPIRAVITTFLLTALAWVFFRAGSMNDAFLILERIFTFKGFFTLNGWDMGGLGLDFSDRLLTFFLVVLFFTTEIIEREVSLIAMVEKQRLWLRWVVFIAALLAMLIFGQYGAQSAYSQFLYFQF